MNNLDTHNYTSGKLHSLTAECVRIDSSGPQKIDGFPGSVFQHRPRPGFYLLPLTRRHIVGGEDGIAENKLVLKFSRPKPVYAATLFIEIEFRDRSGLGDGTQAGGDGSLRREVGGNIVVGEE